MIDDPLIDKTLRYDIVDKINSWGFSKRDNDDDLSLGKQQMKMEMKYRKNSFLTSLLVFLTL